jgi:hypothetical protein
MIHFNIPKSLILIIFCFLLQGCPISAYYSILSDNKSVGENIMLNDCIVQIEAASPWYRSNKKLVSVTIKIVNDNNSLNVLNYNRLKLFSSKNVLFLKSVHPKGRPTEKIIVENDSIFSGRIIFRLLEFESKDKINRRDFWRNLERDTLIVFGDEVKDSLLLIGRDNRKLNSITEKKLDF